MLKYLLPLLTVFVMLQGCAKKVAAVKPEPAKQQQVAQAAPAPARAQAQPERRPAAPTQTAANRTATGPDQATKDRIQDLLNRIQDAYFDYNTSNIRADAEAALHSDAQALSLILKQFPDYKLTIEGYCDERGSEEFNVALGEARAQRAKQFLADAGIPASQLKTVSYGKSRPVCEQHDESCWQKNRRIHIIQAQS